MRPTPCAPVSCRWDTSAIRPAFIIRRTVTPSLVAGTSLDHSSFFTCCSRCAKSRILLPYVVRRTDKNVRFHRRQSMHHPTQPSKNRRHTPTTGIPQRLRSNHSVHGAGPASLTNQPTQRGTVIVPTVPSGLMSDRQGSREAAMIQNFGSHRP